MRILLSLAMSALLFISNVNAQEPGGHHPKGKPPFVTACDGKSLGDECSYTERDGSTVEDICQEGRNPRGDVELICGTPKAPPQNADAPQQMR